MTVAQFRCFLEDSGQRPGDSDAVSEPPNRPVRWVSWHEALGFCDWLEERWRARGWISKDLAVTLPSEPEWEKASRGGLEIPERPVIRAAHSLTAEATLRENPAPDRSYPCEGKVDSNRANYASTEIGKPSAVGCFPGGVSPYGCEELSGNLWEWTRSLWGKEWNKPEFVYPYDPDDGREDIAAPDEIHRVLRGGSFGGYPGDIRCACRGLNGPDDRDYGLGFRVVVSPFSDR